MKLLRLDLPPINILGRIEKAVNGPPAPGVAERVADIVASPAFEHGGITYPAATILDGWRTTYKGVDLVVDDAIPAPAADVLDGLRAIVDVAGDERTYVKRIVASAGSSPTDPYFRTRGVFTDDMSAIATTNDDGIAFWGTASGRFDEVLALHEVGHAVAGWSSAPNGWRAAMRDDSQRLVTRGLVDIAGVEDDGELLARGAITDYARTAVRTTKLLNEDWAESFSFFASLRLGRSGIDDVMAGRKALVATSDMDSFRAAYPSRAEVLDRVAAESAQTARPKPDWRVALDDALGR